MASSLWSFIIYVILLLALGGPAKGDHVVHDVVPEDWITNHEGTTPTKRLLVLPWAHGSPAGYSFPASNILVKGNRIRSSQFVFSAGGGAAAEGVILIVRPDTRKPDLHFRVPESTHRLLRSLSWAEFRRVQADFENHLYRESACRCLCSLFSKAPRDRFNGSFRTQLGAFWLRAMERGAFAKLSDRLAGRFPRLAPDSASATPTLQTMGKIPLVPGMRLLIQWGGTASYQYDIATTITRPTTAGTSHVEVVMRNGAVMLGPDLDWNLASRTPLGEKTDIRLPFGNDEENGRYARRVIPVLNEMDLWQSGGIGALRSSQSRPVLLIPSQYTKPDLASTATAQPPATTSTHSDARVQEDNSVARALTRRFILWWEKTVPDDEAPLRTRIADQPPEHWPEGTLVFGNQSFIVPQVSISIGSTREWASIGYSWADIVRSRSPWILSASLTRTAAEPLLRVRRAPFAPYASDATLQKLQSTEVRFWALPSTLLSACEIFPGDEFLFQP